MRYQDIGVEARPVSVIGLGTTSGIFGPGGDDRVDALIDAFLDAGGNCIDTAHIYGLGESEKAIGRWLERSGRRAEIYLVTKGCHPKVDDEGRFGPPRVTAEAIHADLSESLERLGTDGVDLYLLHRDDVSVEPGPLLEALNEEKASGRIGTFGASNWTVDRIETANRYASDHGLEGFSVDSPGLSLARPTSMFFPGTLFADDDTRRWHTDRQFPMLAWSTLAAGFAGGISTDASSVDEVARVYYSEDNFGRRQRAEELGREKEASGLQVSLAFVLSQPYPTIALVGPSKVSNLEEALGALEIDLTPEDMAYLDLRDQGSN
jgi:aryl-alcohol dehydrogenase-like predicted oxidoreductase